MIRRDVSVTKKEMKIATNVTRDYLGGITVSNVNFLDFIHGTGKGVVGIELNARRYMKGPVAFRHFSPEWFDHNIINIHDLPFIDTLYRSKNIKDLERRYRPIITIIKDVLKKSKPDVVFLNGTYYIPWLISIAAHELHIPIVLRYAGVYSKETEEAKPKIRKFCSEIERSFQKRVDYFIFPSRLCKDVVEKEVSKKEITNYSIVPNSVQVSKFRAVSKTVDRRILAVGRWDGIKNFQSFFKLHTLLKKEKWTHEASFITGGAKKIKGMPKTINRLASMTHDELMSFYTSQGLIISPSRFETFGNVPVEAACLGVPVLVSENMGCAEIFKTAGLENMVISFSDLSAVAKRVKKLCGQRILPRQMNNLRKYVDPVIVNTEIAAILREVAENATALNKRR